jgi:hypothetical protein
MYGHKVEGNVVHLDLAYLVPSAAHQLQSHAKPDNLRLCSIAENHSLPSGSLIGELRSNLSAQMRSLKSIEEHKDANADSKMASKIAQQSCCTITVSAIFRF